MVLFEGERGRKLVGDLPASKWELDTLPDLSSYKRPTDHCEYDSESDVVMPDLTKSELPYYTRTKNMQQ